MDNSDSQLIRTKLLVPKLRSRIIDRRRLVELATSEPDAVLTLVSAPAGYGKTTLMVELSQALDKSGTAIAWYAIDPSDNDPNLFSSYLIAALGKALKIDIPLAPVARLLRSSTEFDMDKILPSIVNAVVSKEQKCLLVLDDYHYIASPAIHSFITHLIDHLPENMHMIVGSRSDPPLPLARLRASDKLTEIRMSDLRFTTNEATKFLNETMGLGLPSEAIDEIEARTEGWVTGLQLAALSMPSMDKAASFVSRFGGNNRYLVEYLLQEVIEQRPAELQRFLLATSVLGRLCGPLCDAVLGVQTGSDIILHQLERANLFLVPLDEEGCWYRYHHLFQNFLQNRLKQIEPDRLSQLHRAASEWYSSQYLLREAVSHAFETQDWVYAATVVEQYGMTMFLRSEISILFKWCANFPEEIFRTHPMLCILQGWTLSLTYRKENQRRVEERLLQAEQTICILENKQRGRWLTGQAALVRLSLCLIPNPSTDPGHILVLAQRALDLLPGDDSVRSLATSAIGYAHLSLQNVPIALKTMEEYRRLSLSGGFYYGAVAATFHLANLLYYQGEFKRAKEICNQVQASIAKVIANPEQELPAVGSLDIVQGCILLEENRLDEAERILLHGLELIGWTINPYTRMIACIALFRLCEIQGREAEAIRYLDDIEEAWPDIAFCTQGLKLMHLIRTKPEDSQTLAQAESWCWACSSYIGANMPLPGIGPFGGAQAYYLASLIWVYARILLGKPAETLSYLDRQQSMAEAQGLTYRLIELSLVEAQARKALGEDQQALRSLERALKLAKSIGCTRVFDQSPALTRLLEEAFHRGIYQDFIGQIMKTISIYPGFLGFKQQDVLLLSSTGVASVKGSFATLSDRELEVLCHVANGASNQEIADRLFVTVGTVKSHINHILGKLDAHNRLEAIIHAREQGLLKI